MLFYRANRKFYCMNVWTRAYFMLNYIFRYNYCVAIIVFDVHRKVCGSWVNVASELHFINFNFINPCILLHITFMIITFEIIFEQLLAERWFFFLFIVLFNFAKLNIKENAANWKLSFSLILFSEHFHYLFCLYFFFEFDERN